MKPVKSIWPLFILTSIALLVFGFIFIRDNTRDLHRNQMTPKDRYDASSSRSGDKLIIPQRAVSSESSGRTDGSRLVAEIEMLMDEKPSPARQTQLAELAARLSAEIGLMNAAGLLESVVGPGRDRDWLLASAVGGSNESFEDVMGVCRERAEGSRGGLENGLVGLVLRRKLTPAEISAAGPFSTDELSKILSGLGLSASRRASELGSFEATTQECFRLIDSNIGKELSSQLKLEYLMNASQGAPQEALGALLQVIGRDGLSEAGRFSSDQVVRAAIRSDPQRAIKEIISERENLPEIGTTNLMSLAISSWMRNDEDAAYAWWISQTDKHVISSAAAPFVKQALTINDLDRARELAHRVEDPVGRENAEGWIWSKERDLLREEVKNQPVRTVQGIVEGTSSFDPYWLEEAVYTWVSKDFDAANAWHEKNWNSLPREKAQYVAAGFATQAIGQGDVDTARQWAAMIQDTKTKERIEASIVKAEAEPR